ncbi:MAG TPA: GNAT family N-acetyltransferase [Pelomicrobium sp.]|nr:GNAT family N-acetyltransferase [Pelomicrobium sp.]
MSDSIVFRPALPRDATAIALMSRDLVEDGFGWRYTPGRIAASIRHRDTMVLVADVEGQLGAFAIMEFGDDRAHLVLLAVRPRLQRRGLARRMILWLEKSARTAGIVTVTLELRAANRGARALYHSLGYREVARLPRYYAGRETAVRMAHDLVHTVAPDT